MDLDVEGKKWPRSLDESEMPYYAEDNNKQ